MKLAPNIRKK